METLPDPVSREPAHTRAITTQGFLRADGLWDLEAELVDTKAYSTTTNGDRSRAAGEPVHRMYIRLTIDDSLIVRAAVAAMSNTPFDECTPAAGPFGGLVGSTIGPGWRKQIDAAMGGVRGCTHLRELLGVMATVAFQTVPGYRRHQRLLRGDAPLVANEPDHQMGKCLSWDFDGPVIYLGRLLTQWVDQSRLRQFNARFAGITHLGHQITCTGKVVDVFEADGEKRAKVEIQTANQYGEVKIVGDAIVAL